jgi:GDA1/CD39 (nucleoside phosphatase) family
MDTLIANIKGTGAVRKANLTYGVLEMGGASAQIGFFEPEGDVMANLFKLQIGAAKHWNVYAHSFLYFGVNGAFDRFNARLYTEAVIAANATTGVITEYVYNPCLPGGAQYVFTSRVHMMPDGNMLPLSRPDDPGVLEADMYSMLMHNPNATGDFDQCMRRASMLLRMNANQWCDFAHDWDCSFAGIYQVGAIKLCALMIRVCWIVV